MKRLLLLAALAAWALLAWGLALAGMGGRVLALANDPTLVQPLPRRVPKPTSRPAASSQGSGKPLRGASPLQANHAAAAASRPARKASRQPRSCLRSIALLTMPLIPAMRPMPA